MLLMYSCSLYLVIFGDFLLTPSCTLSILWRDYICLPWQRGEAASCNQAALWVSYGNRV